MGDCLVNQKQKHFSQMDLKREERLLKLMSVNIVCQGLAYLIIYLRETDGGLLYSKMYGDLCTTFYQLQTTLYRLVQTAK